MALARSPVLAACREAYIGMQRYVIQGRWAQHHVLWHGRVQQDPHAAVVSCPFGAGSCDRLTS